MGLLNISRTARVGLLALLLGCAPADGPDPSRIDGLRVLAVQVDPPETTPGMPVTISVTTAGEAAGEAARVVDWAWCATPKPPTENNVVDPACLGSGVAAIQAAGSMINATVPADACRLFGPISPGPGLRARDADVTGGYYQPVRVTVGEAVAFGLVRLRCGLPQAPLAATQRYTAEYTDNLNPALLVVEVPAIVSRGAIVELRVETDAPEPYLRFDPAARALVEETEQLAVSWFTTAGHMATDRSAVTDGVARIEWRAPAAEGVAEIFIVLRDSRGGMTVQPANVDVR